MEKTRLLKSHILTIVFACIITLLTGCEMKGSDKLTAVPFTDVTIADEFWAPRMQTNRNVTIPYAFKKCEETGRIDNFAKAAGLMEGKFEGIRFNDSDVFKVIEGAAYSLHLYPDPELDKYLDDLIAKIAAAQEDDGYLYTCRTIDANNLPGDTGKTRWSYLAQSHELYNVGHMYEAAVAHYQATGKRTFLDVAIKNADLIDRVFGPNKKRDVPGHQEIEIGLVKLYRVTGNKKYLKLAKFFLDQRGRADGRKLYGEYCQDHKPVVEQDAAVGHAVRAAYMYSGMADVALLTGDSRYVEALDRIWQDVVTGKLYITGGIGARHGGESFGQAYELPNKTAYCETCAAIANAMWNHRMFLLHGDAKYIDLVERIIYNGFLSGISMSGEKFFYQNPLASDGKYERSPWFGCACCPTNIVRFLPSLPGYAYAQRGNNLYVNLFIGGAATIRLPNNTVRLTQQTHYPWDGNVSISVEPERPAEFAVCVRIPGWLQNRPVPSDLYRYSNISNESVTLKVNGEVLALEMDKGFTHISRKWNKADLIDIHFPMTVRRVLCHDNVKDNVGRVALERGPIVYCAEWLDNGGQVDNLALSDDAQLEAEYRSDMLNGVTVIRGKAQSLYSSKDRKYTVTKEQEFVAIPYYAWAHRGPGEMAVWLTKSP
jgi:DUF1680 family protein